VANLVYVVKNELEVTQLELDGSNKEKESLSTKMKHVQVVHE